MELPSDLVCVFNTNVVRRNGSYVLEIPESEIDHGAIAEGDAVQVSVSESGIESQNGQDTRQQQTTSNRQNTQRSESSHSPPVEAGEVHNVTIEDVGDQGDGIAKVDRGFVLIVPGSSLGDELDVEITTLKDNFAIAEPVDELTVPAE